MRVASIQMTSNQSVEDNLLLAKEFIQQAVEQKAQLIVLPEMFALMGLDQMDQIKYSEKFGQGVVQDFLQEQSQRHHVWIVGGTLPLVVSDEKNKVHAACLVWNDQGECVVRYDKMHLFDVTAGDETYSESTVTKPGEQIVVVPTPFGRLGLAVCYDVRFPELFRKMHESQVDMIALPAAFTFTTGSVHWDILVRARAIENLSYVIAACQTGEHANGRRTYGHSMIVNPWGKVLAFLPEKPGVIVSEIDLDYLQKIRRQFPALDHRRLF